MDERQRFGQLCPAVAPRGATVRSLDVVLPVKDRGDLRLRLVSKPDRPVAELLVRLGVKLPSRPKNFENVVEKMAL
jgi:hypothetical protein